MFVTYINGPMGQFDNQSRDNETLDIAYTRRVPMYAWELKNLNE